MPFVGTDWESEPDLLGVLLGNKEPTSTTPLNGTALKNEFESVAEYAEDVAGGISQGEPGPPGAIAGFVLNLADYDVVGDGSAVDGAKIQDAIDDAANAAALGAATVMFPVGNYRITTPLIAKSGVKLLGQGLDVTIISGDPGSNSCFVKLSQPEGDTLSHFTITDIFFDGTDWSAGTSNTHFENGVIFDDGEGNCEDITLERLRIYGGDETRQCANCIRSVDNTGTGLNKRWKVKDCRVLSDSDTAYGIILSKRCEGVWIEDNDVELTLPGQESVSIGALNCIGVYGDSSNFHIIGNTVKCDKAHSPIAASCARMGEIVGNTVICVRGIASEAGIEVEWKAGHSDDTGETYGVTVSGNTVIGAYWGIFVGNRDPGTFPTKTPYGISIAGNTLISCTTRDIMVSHGDAMSIGSNAHYDSGQEYDMISEEVTFSNRAVFDELDITGELRIGALLPMGQEAITFLQGGRIVIANEDIYFEGTAKGLRANGTNGVLRFSTTGSGGGMEFRPGDQLVLSITQSGVLFSGKPQWLPGLTQDTVGAAGGASAPPATPDEWLKVTGPTGANYVIPAYHA